MSSNNVDLTGADTLERYMDGSLGAETRSAVEQRIRCDPAFAAEVSRLRQTEAAMRQMGRSMASPTLRPAAEAKARAAMHAALDGRAPARAFAGRWLAGAMVAAMVLVIAVVVWPGAHDALLGQPQQVSAPTAAFKWEQLAPDSATVRFTNLSGNYTDQRWDFGDGQSSTEANPVHDFGKVGDYTVKLSVSNNKFNASIVHTVHITAQPPANSP